MMNSLVDKNKKAEQGSKANKKGYKRTKLGWIPEDWDTSTLKTCGYFSKGKGISKEEVKESGFPCIRYGEIYMKYNFVVNNIESYINKVSASNSKKITSKDILFAGSGELKEEIGKCVVLSEKYSNTNVYAGGDIVIWTPNNSISSLYLSYFLNTFGRRQINRLGQGDSIVHIYSNHLENLNIPLPKSNEQQKIAEILTKWDEGIETLEKLIEKKQLFKKALMQELLTGKIRLKAFEDEKWKHKKYKLEDLFINRKENNCCGLELLSICDGIGVVPRSQLNAKDNSNEDKSKYLRVCSGDIAYNTMRMWQGRCGLSTYEGIVSPAYTVCTPKDLIDAKYMFYLFKTPHMIHDFWRYSQGIVDDTLQLKYDNFRLIKVEIPSKENQIKISNILNTCDEEIKLLNFKLEKLKQQKKGLMQKLLTGQVRVKI